MGPRGTPARQYASSAFTPRERSVRRASPQLSLPPRDVTRAMLMGLSNRPNLPRILPIWAEKLCRARIWIILLKSHQYTTKGAGDTWVVATVCTWAACLLASAGPASDWTTASPQNKTLSCSVGQEAVCSSSSTERTPGPITAHTYSLSTVR